MDPETRRKIEETVLDILRKANVEEMTEFEVRLAASKRLGIDLFEPQRKGLVRSVVENFLLSTMEDEEGRGGDGKLADSNVREETKEVEQEEEDEEQETRLKKEVNDGGDRVVCKLSNKRRVVIQDFRGKTLVSIREFYEKDGKQIPTAKGISLSTEQWSAFRKSVPAIEEAVSKMELKLRSHLDGKQTEDVCNSVSDLASQEVVAIATHRFYGKNYRCWAQQMEIFLKQSKIAYVLTDPCPSVSLGREATAEEIARAKHDELKWVNDDCICRSNILSSLSDPLFYQYSKRAGSAKELWEELKLVYLYEEFGTKRSQVKNYIEFQMVEERPVVEQVQEFNNIADAIVAAGMSIDENFHVSVIISKLPPSWKDFCIKLMREEYLPFRKLMDHLRIEEECRSQEKQRESSTLLGDHNIRKFIPNSRDLKPPGMRWNRRESEMDGRPKFCHNCGKKGHISRNCRAKFVKENNENRDVDNGSMPAVTEV
ncbi:hypothetical protein FH972_003792 [Carpinus fangiana]|uniref:Uncharacterized protein n=1 Tax=Carpinus fangiana TaxID=176857 RepID=A0A5N6QJ34_9ROSI|nr:hypothetical protein FH972_003792 [Carpinus fangiana]